MNNTLTLDVPVETKEIPIGSHFFLTIVFIGLVLNCSIVIVIGSARQLRYPRHWFWLFISLADCIFLSECLLEVAVTSYKIKWACDFFVVLAGVDYSMLLICLSLAALDRYVVIANYEWYKKNINNNVVIFVTLVGTSGTFLAMTSPFLLGFIPYEKCTINLTLLFFDFTWDLILGIACVMLHTLTFVKARRLIKQMKTSERNTPIAMRFVRSGIAKQEVKIWNRSGETGCASQQELNTHITDLPFLTDQPGSKCFPTWFYSKNKFSRLEIRVAFDMSINILPFWLCTFPVTINVIAMYWCIRSGRDCTAFFQVGSYLRDLFMLHTIYNPIMYISSSSEFRRAAWHSLWKIKHFIR